MRLKTNTKEELIFATVLLVELILLARETLNLQCKCPGATVECTACHYTFGPFFLIMIGLIVATIAIGIVLFIWNKIRKKI